MRPGAPISPDSPNADMPHGGECMFRRIKEIGHGNFGTVYLAEVVSTKEVVAIKEVLIDRRLSNRELAIMRDVVGAADPSTGADGTHSTSKGKSRSSTVGLLARHPCIVNLRAHYVSVDPKNCKYLNLVMSYLPTNLAQLKRHYCRSPPTTMTAATSSGTALRSPLVGRSASTSNTAAMEGAGGADAPSTRRMPLLLAKVILFQCARALAFLHSRNVCHRDIKPANVLVDPVTGRAQLCDFGSAKQITNRNMDKNVSYICTRYYRAPELLFGALHYGCEVDLWSYGCIAVELLRDSDRALFRGSSTVDQMAEIFKVLGAPSQTEMMAMNPQGAEAMLRMHDQYYPSAGVPVRDGAVRDATSAALPGSMPPGETTTASPRTLTTSGYSSRSADDAQHFVGTTAATPFPTPSASPVSGVNSDYFDFYDVLKIRAVPWSHVLPEGTAPAAIDLVSQLLCYVPAKRLTAVDVVEHHFFDELFTLADTRLPSGSKLPVEMFMLTADEANLYSENLQDRMHQQVLRIRAGQGRTA